MHVGALRNERGNSVLSEDVASLTLVERFSAAAAATPAALAVGDGTLSLSYGELDRLSNQLANYLWEAGVGADSCVAILQERSAQFVVAALAVLKAGAAYLPLDAGTPADRVAFILADAGAKVLLSHRQKAAGISLGSCTLIETDGADAPRIAARPTTPPRKHADDADLAYVVYTSGSTGKPKGVEITHGNLLNLIEWHQSAFGVTAADRASQVAGLGFDAAGWEIWPHLTAGASLHFADEIIRRSPQALREWLIAEKITIAFVPTVLAEQLLFSQWPADAALRVFLTGADVLHRRPPAGLPFVLVNNYGPSECTVVATSGIVESSPAGDLADLQPSIGRAILNAQIFILDDSLRPVPRGEAGELCIAGALVGRGYRNNPQITASRFVEFLPEGAAEPVRIYRTGDRAKWLDNGELAFLGRLDDQVKIRGYRIELGEIVARLDRFPGVEASAAVVHESPADGASLTAYVVPAAGAALNGQDLREFLAQKLPDYMIPARFVAIKELPTTANGKLDKAALPAPSAASVLPGKLPSEVQPPAAPENADLQNQIGELVAALLGQPAVGREENFFMIGGHSMLGVQLVARLRDRFGVKLALRQLFSAPTVVALSAEVARLLAAK